MSVRDSILSTKCPCLINTNKILYLILFFSIFSNSIFYNNKINITKRKSDLVVDCVDAGAVVHEFDSVWGDWGGDFADWELRLLTAERRVLANAIVKNPR
jgi:hypothetical protein